MDVDETSVKSGRLIAGLPVAHDSGQGVWLWQGQKQIDAVAHEHGHMGRDVMGFAPSQSQVEIVQAVDIIHDDGVPIHSALDDVARAA